MATDDVIVGTCQRLVQKELAGSRPVAWDYSIIQRATTVCSGVVLLLELLVSSGRFHWCIIWVAFERKIM